MTGLLCLLILIRCCSPFCPPAIGLHSVKIMLLLVCNAKCFQHLPLQISQDDPQGRAMMATRDQQR